MTVIRGLAVLGLLMSLLLLTMSESPTFIPTDELPPTTEPLLACSCMPCKDNPNFNSVHTQKNFCESAAVIQGRITQKTIQSENKGIWNQGLHTSFFGHGYRPTHFDLSVRVLAVYSDQSGHNLRVGDKITVRYERITYCPQCQSLVEQFSDEADPQWRERELKRSEKYIFFLPVLETGFGDRLEATLDQCTMVWKYSKRGKSVEGGIPLVKRYMLTATTCDKCRVSGCYQNKCVKVDEEEQCEDRYAKYTFKENSCKEIMTSGLCYYHAGTDSCRWTSITEDGVRSRKVIEHCLSEDQ